MTSRMMPMMMLMIVMGGSRFVISMVTGDDDLDGCGVREHSPDPEWPRAQKLFMYLLM